MREIISYIISYHIVGLEISCGLSYIWFMRVKKKINPLIKRFFFLLLNLPCTSRMVKLITLLTTHYMTAVKRSLLEKVIVVLVCQIVLSSVLLQRKRKINSGTCLWLCFE